MIRFRNLCILAGGALMPTTFVDTFNRADTAQGLGAGYIGMPRSSLQSSQALPMCRIVSTQLVTLTQGVGAGSKVPGTLFLPVSILNTAVYGKAQYAELTFVSQVGADCDTGAAVMVTGDFASQDQVGYFCRIQSSTNEIALDLLTTVRTGLATAPYIAAAGDVLRIECRPTAANNVLTVFVNGAAVITVTDANAARPVLTGYPALWNWAMTIGTSQNYSRFAGGIL